MKKDAQSLAESAKADAKEIWNVPNVLTMLRIVLVAVFAVVFMKEYYVAAIIIFIVAALTDLLDGYIARRTGKITNFGKLMDPFADKAMLIVALICLVNKNFLPPFILVFVIVKEVVMILGALLLYSRHVVVYAKGFGKAATFVFNTGVALSILGRAFAPLYFIAEYHIDVIVLVIAIVLAVCAFAQYAYLVWKQMKAEK